jgi:hypothetical protein
MLFPTPSHQEFSMGFAKTDKGSKSKLRGSALEGSDQKTAPDHMDYEKGRDPDAEVRLDGEEDTLYSDGLDLDEGDSDDLAGTRGNSSGIKP